MTEQDESPARVLVLNGPNLSRLGKREPDIYGAMNYDQLVEFCTTIGADMNLDVEVRQTDSESELIGWIHEAVDSSTPVVLNPAAFTHYLLRAARRPCAADCHAYRGSSEQSRCSRGVPAHVGHLSSCGRDDRRIRATFIRTGFDGHCVAFR